MNARLVPVIALWIAFALSLPVTAQDKKDSSSSSVSITGCFNKGAAADQYVIKDDKTGKQTVVTGDTKLLSAHANNHQVTITGTMAKDKDSKEILKATDLKMIAVCK